ncbi:hypothetical protein CDAR_269511 [Caerostris darwini]|uniref:Uncharacterized protein n=1 Tax=Caerostris darwini TaxID=1538125 RepID=A0AAV4VRL4_9ARAC|nr:hypothetical protein CDAR_269511 [Caerostris darwini]
MLCIPCTRSDRGLEDQPSAVSQGDSFLSVKGREQGVSEYVLHVSSSIIRLHFPPPKSRLDWQLGFFSFVRRQILSNHDDGNKIVGPFTLD